ncbi:Tyrosine-protein kinase wzc [Polystyrenella longa]|uniref:Tyrosine-protein kinase wzc n=1 Tax=Polystyrenella longa TaxID=2528007 RepID=A0A518CHE5_9PLAN|nr:polysaccharide biosynthesis tyrosine autokinase [Polystyrenella longa]QDU78641.1 Tyrosine-protein kinase wzc [Polystyrenella longa]
MNPYLDQSNSNESSNHDNSTSAMMARVMRFLRVIMLRKKIIVVCVILSSVAGAYRYSTQIPMFQSTAQLLILSNGGFQTDDVSGQSLLKNQMPTYTRLLSSDRVLETAASHLPPEHQVDVSGNPMEMQVKILRSQLSTSVSPQTNLIDIRFTSQSPETAAYTIDQVIMAYLKFMEETHQNGTQNLLKLLTEDQTKMENQYQENANQLIELQRRSDLLLNSGSETVSLVGQRILSLQTAYTEAQNQMIKLESLIKVLKQAIEKGSNAQQYAEEILGPGPVGNELLSQEMGLQDRLIVSRLQDQLKVDQAELKSKLTTLDYNHPDVMVLTNRIQSAEDALQQRLQSNQSSYHVQQNRRQAQRLLEIAEQKLVQYEERYRALKESYLSEEEKGRESTLVMLKIKQLETHQTRIMAQHDTLLQKIREVDLDDRASVLAKTVKKPEISRYPISPNKIRTAMFSLILGIAMGIGVIVVLEALDDRFRSPDEIKYHLNLPVLAMVRKMEETTGYAIDAVQTHVNPNSVESEAFRTLRTAISFSSHESRRLLVTSTEKSDGKTTVMANLAVAFAQSNKKTLIVDTDMRRPGMTNLLELRKEEGLSKLLRSEEPVDQCAVELIQPSGSPNLDILPSGSRPVNPSELLSSNRLSDFLSWAETVYDQIIIDAPPILAVSDAGIVGRLVDTLVLVMRPDKNRRGLVYRSVETLQMFGIHISGIVVNHLTPDQGSDYYGYGYGYGYSEDYGHEESTGEDGYDEDGYGDGNYQKEPAILGYTSPDSGQDAGYEDDDYETNPYQAA